MPPDELEGLVAVLNHPAHQAGIGERILTIVRIEQPAERLVRLSATISGDDSLADWDVPNPTVRLAIPEPPPEFARIVGAPQTTSRVYTLTDIDVASRTVEIDLVRHPEQSPAMRWLDDLAVGDTVTVVGPRPHRIPGDGAPLVLLADSSALPAATRILRRLPAAGPALLLAAVPEDEFALAQQRIEAENSSADLRRVDPASPTPLADAFAQLTLPSTASVWASGERDDIRQIRHACKHEVGLPPERMQVFGYWKHGMTNTRIDVARLRATQRVLAGGGELSELDDFDIEL